jgi:hypothetical protein
VHAAEKVADESAQITFKPTSCIQTINVTDLMAKKVAIKTILNRYNSPLADHIDTFIEVGNTYDMDYYLLPAISGLESSFGVNILPNSYNAWGWDRGYMMFNNWDEAIATVGKGLREGYLNEGRLSVYDIGPKYSESATWAVRVDNFIAQFKLEEEKNKLLFRQTKVQL